ncbi:MAG: hypothetical protein S4CHLAM7_04660 [Chlamydiae bacterium]|nr:hypothetical protein [Chlamydiota bacterium]
MSNSDSDHFEGETPFEHILKKKEEMANEIHGDELPGHMGAFLDATRDTSALLLIFWTIALQVGLTAQQMTLMLLMLGIGWLVWKIVRSTWLAQTKLERLHRILKEERYEIENHRPQEREELAALYAAKGFKGELLEEVLDVLMADDDRLLKVMIEEEMGLSLENCEHPLKVGSGAALGVVLAVAVLFLSQWISPQFALFPTAALLIGVSGYYIAKLQKNEKTSAFVWNIAFATLTYGTVYFLSRWFLSFNS